MTGIVIVGGEVTTKGWVDIPELVRGVVEKIGYDDSSMGSDTPRTFGRSSGSRSSPNSTPAFRR